MYFYDQRGARFVHWLLISYCFFRPTAVTLLNEITNLTKKYEDAFDTIRGKSKLQMLEEIKHGEKAYVEPEVLSPSLPPLIAVRLR